MAVVSDGDNNVSPALIRRIAGQGTLLFVGFSASQILSFLRNAVMAYGLSHGDFGVAATIFLVMQLLEVMTDVGVDRFVLQAADAGDEQVLATAHTGLVLRGLTAAALLYVFAGPFARLFQIQQATWAIELIAGILALKGFTHLGLRLRQRHLDNRLVVLVEVVPQVLAVLVVTFLLRVSPTYEVAVWAAFAQAGSSVLLSHVLAWRRYSLGFDPAVLRRLFAFGWPAWISALTVVAVLQGDRAIIGSVLGTEALASFTVVFMITMVPSLIAGRIGQALMLPLLSAARDNHASFRAHFSLICQVMTLAAVAHVVLFASAGDELVPLAFGANYRDLGAVVLVVGAIWGLRIVQVAPVVALTALGLTQPIMVAGLVRAALLPLGLLLAIKGYGLAAIACAGLIGEILALAVIARFAERARRGLGRTTIRYAVKLLPSAATAWGIGTLLSDIMVIEPALSLLAGVTLTALVVGFTIIANPSLRALAVSLRTLIAERAPIPI